jgi:hypothetical protein
MSKYDTKEGWKLVNKDTLTEVKVGDQVETNDGEKVTVTWLSPPHKESSQGKVSVRFTGTEDWTREFYASVIGAEYQHEGDTS